MANIAQKPGAEQPDLEESGITKEDFLDVVFADIQDDERVCITRARPKKSEPGQMWFDSYLEDDPAFTKWDPAVDAQALFYCVSTVSGALNDKGTMVSRKRSDLKQYHVIVLDDIGPGGKTGEPPVKPSYKLETSPGSFHWGYCLIPGDDFALYEAVVEAVHQLGFGDKGAGGSYRVVRLPGSMNQKEGRGEFRSVITEWWPERVWTLEEFATAFGLDINALPQKRKKKTAVAVKGATPDTPDPLLIWLHEAGLVVNDDEVSNFVEVKCPNAAQHTTGSDVGHYSPLGRGDAEWITTRGWVCHHGHCSDWHFKEFMKAMGDLGAPKVSAHDVLPWLQHRYVYIVVGKLVADLHQRPHGGDWIFDLEDWSNLYKGRIMVPGRTAPVDMKTAFLEHKGTRKVIGTQYWPVKAEDDTAVIIRNGQERINSYTPPDHPYTSKDPDVFLDHIDFLLPGDLERDLFLDWLAYKIQNPASRSYAVLMVAEKFGIGRSWIRAMMTLVLQGKVQTASLAQLIGKGTSAQKNYNDWVAECQLLVVEEAKDNLTKEDFYGGYETFKQNVDTRVMPVRVNPKYGHTRDDFMFFNALIFSNHSDALALPETDRRVCVLTNATEVESDKYYEELHSALNDDEAGAVYHYLMRRDVSAFNHQKPPMTPGKEAMIEQNRPPSDAIKEHILEHCEGDLFTKKMLKSRVIAAAAALDYDNIQHSPGGVIRTLWGKMGALRKGKNGARYHINGETVEIRAIRNVKKWEDADIARAREEFETELLKNDKSGGKGLKQVK